MPIVNMRRSHGTPSEYRRGCRCDLCRAAEATYQRQRREARKQAKEREAFIASTQGRGKPIPPNARIRHGGTRTGYLRGCRCDLCVEAERSYQRQRKEAIKAGTWTGRATTDSKEAT